MLGYALPGDIKYFMHILFLTDNFPPEVNAPASRTFEHCREWARAGYQITVITCVPNFPKGRVFTGYRNRLWQSEEMSGVRVIRVWSFIAANEGFVKRILDYVSFMLSATVAAFFVRKPDVVIGTSPQFFTACAAYLVSRFKRIPFVFELRDLWPESIKAVGAMKESTVIRLLEQIEMFLYQKADRIISVTHSFQQKLVIRGVDADKIFVMTNGVDMSRFRPVPKDEALLKELQLEGKFVAGYVGTHGLAHHLETLLEAADKIRKLPNGDLFRFVLLGDGARKKVLQEEAVARKLNNVIFINSVPKGQVARYWSLLNVSIIHLKKTDLFTSVIPSKLFECMGMGLPVLHGVAGESAEIVRDNDIGIVFEPENADELVTGLILLQKDQVRYARYKVQCSAAAKNYDRKVIADSMLDAILRLKKN